MAPMPPAARMPRADSPIRRKRISPTSCEKAADDTEPTKAELVRRRRTRDRGKSSPEIRGEEALQRLQKSDPVFLAKQVVVVIVEIKRLDRFSRLAQRIFHRLAVCYRDGEVP